jgi:hypothetical protein
MSTNKPLVCLCCKKTYLMPTNIIPATVAPWQEFGLCEACDTVVITGRILDRVHMINEFIGEQFDVNTVTEISEVSTDVPEPVKPVKIKQVRTRQKKPVTPEVKEVRPPYVLPKVFTPAAKAQLSLFDMVTDMANEMF